MREGIKESQSSQGISYLLQEPSMFFQAGYKVMRTQEKNGFLPCTKIRYNGKDKLVYTSEPYKVLDALIPSLEPDTFLDLIEQLITVILEVNKNGFLQCENFNTDFDRLFVDTSDYSLHFLYLPVKTTGNGGTAKLEDALRRDITSVLDRFHNLASPSTKRLCALLQNSIVTLESMLEILLNRQKSPQLESIHSLPQDAEPEKPTPESVPQPLEEPKQEKRRRLPFRRKAAKQNRAPGYRSAPQEIAGGATEVLEELFEPSIMLQGLNTPEEVEILITKEDFKIGKYPDAVDGVISFNNAISRQHCRILRRNGQYYIADMGSSNGTYLNGGRLAPQQEVSLKPGDKLKLANTNLMVKKV